MSKIRLYGGTSGYIELAAPDVSDDATLTLPTGAAGFVPGDGGIGTNVVQAVKTDVFSSTSATFEDITGLTVSITPTTNTSKVLVIASVAASNSSNFADGTELQLVRNSTNIFLGTGGSSTNQTQFILGSNGAVNRYTSVFLDSPATTSATTYKMQMRVLGSSTGYVNRRGTDATRGVPSSITAIEVAA